MIVGITGSIGSGKTAAAKLFSKRHYSRIDADGIGHGLIEKGSAAYKKIIAEFGIGILGKDKNIDRKKVGDAVFYDEIKLKKLDSIIHPAIIDEIKNRIKEIKHKCGDKTKIIIDAPLLLEIKAKNLVDTVIVVKCNKENILKRLNKKYPKDKIERILKVQMPLDEKMKYADFVIDNNGSFEHLENQVKKIIQKLEK